MPRFLSGFLLKGFFMEIQLSDHFNTGKLIRFVIPSIGMMIFTSIYGVVDGFFVSNYAGSTPFAAINLIMPFLMIFSAIGFMIGTGGTALVSLKLGAGVEKEARETFSLLVYVVIVLGLISTVAGEIFLKRVAVLLGATEELLPYCVEYGRIILIALVPFMLQNLFQSFLVAAEKPGLGFKITVAAGVTNMAMDAVLVGALKMGVTGAALATALSQMVGGIIPLVYFILPNSSRLRLGKTSLDWLSIWKASSNGASEFMTNISMSVVNMLYNKQILKLAGENGVAAYGVIMYVNFIFVAVFIGYSIGTAPIIGFNYGANNTAELKNIFKKSMYIIAIDAVVMTGLAMLLAHPLALIYVGYNAELLAMTENGFKIYSISFLIMGFNIYGSSFFTALNNGAVSATISFLRTLVFQIICVLVLPIFWGLNGVWLSVCLAETFSLLVTVFFWIKKKNVYHYA